MHTYYDSIAEDSGFVATLTHKGSTEFSLMELPDTAFLARYRVSAREGLVGDVTMAYGLVEPAIPLKLERPSHELDWITDESIDRLLSSFTGLYEGRLARRLRYLVDAAAEEGLALGIESLTGLAEFLMAHSQLLFPDVVLSQSGNVRAEWVAGRNRHFVVEFLGSGGCRFVLFAPNRNHHDKTIRLSGLLSVDLLLSEIEAQGTVNWISRE